MKLAAFDQILRLSVFKSPLPFGSLPNATQAETFHDPLDRCSTCVMSTFAKYGCDFAGAKSLLGFVEDGFIPLYRILSSRIDAVGNKCYTYLHPTQNNEPTMEMTGDITSDAFPAFCREHGLKCAAFLSNKYNTNKKGKQQ